MINISSFILFSPFVVIVARAYNTCHFGLNSNGGYSGPVGQLQDGQLRLGGYYPQSSFTIDYGGVTDASGRGCILTQDIGQYQCDSGAEAARGFAIGEDGVLSHDGNPEFYACPASETEYNVYTIPVAGQSKCVSVTLTADSCYAPSMPKYSSVPPHYPKPTYSPAPTYYPTPGYYCTPTTVTITQTIQPSKSYAHPYKPYKPYKKYKPYKPYKPYYPHPTKGYYHHKGHYYHTPPKYYETKYETKTM